MIPPHHHATIADLLAHELPPGETFQLGVASDSMQPLMRAGDTLIAQPVRLADLRRGDLVVVRRAQDFVTHRLVALSGETWLIKADNHAQADPPIDPAQITGRVIAIEQPVRRINLQSQAWLFAGRFLGWSSWMEIKAVKYLRSAWRPFRILNRLVCWILVHAAQ